MRLFGEYRSPSHNKWENYLNSLSNKTVTILLDRQQKFYTRDPSSPSVFSGVRVSRFLVLYV
jgi:hypothetical protein